MFLTTGEINRAHMIVGIVNATVKRTLTPDEIDDVDNFDDLYEKVKTRLIERTVARDGDGIVAVHFVPEIVSVGVGPKYIILHGYGTAISFPKK
ncbi:MAG: hypothetical protein ABF991_06610 [Liquorilactobacillus hordei]|uniref:hypothetical protein n=1 Tax=Liquorilactobacillus hordei TaxID=468911 RepID=UPI0039ED4ECA